MGILLGVLFAAKRALDVVPNVELVSLLLIIYTLYIGKKTYYIALGFACLECLIWGITIWSVFYFYVWPILITLVLITKNRARGSRVFYSVLSGLFGLVFGALCAIPYIFISGFAAAVAWWMAGLSFDLIHGVSNFFVCLILFKPLDQLFDKLVNKRSA
jgi:energy-coupling factor transport system substrate-specific component